LIIDWSGELTHGPREGQVVEARADLVDARSSRYLPGGLS